MRKLVASGAVLIACFCSTTMNWRFSFQLGASEFDGYTWAVFSVALDIAKWFMLPVAALMWSTHKTRAAAAASVWFVATIYSFTAALGFAALNRDTTNAEHQQQVELRKTLATMRESSRWRTSAACSDATAKRSKEFCDIYRATASRANASATVVDPQSVLLARLTGLQPDAVRLALCVFLATACEVISALGFYALLSPPATLRQPPPVRSWKPPAWSGPTVPSLAPARHDPPSPAAPRPTRTWKNPR